MYYHEYNWGDAYESVSQSNVPRNSSVISSHCVYKLTYDDEVKFRRKVRIVFYGYRDAEKDTFRKFGDAAYMVQIRILISVVSFHSFEVGIANIKGAFMHSGPYKVYIYIYFRHPRELRTTRETLCSLLKFPY